MQKVAEEVAAAGSEHHDVLKSIGNNVAFGLLSNPRGAGPVSLFGQSAGGVLDGFLFKPVVDGGIDLVGKGLRWAYGVKNDG